MWPPEQHSSKEFEDFFAAEKTPNSKYTKAVAPPEGSCLRLPLSMAVAANCRNRVMKTIKQINKDCEDKYLPKLREYRRHCFESKRSTNGKTRREIIKKTSKNYSRDEEERLLRAFCLERERRWREEMSRVDNTGKTPLHIAAKSVMGLIKLLILCDYATTENKKHG